MKLPTYAILAAALACGLASAQTTAYTTPVGYISHTIAAGTSLPSDTYISPSLVQPTEYAGASTVSPSGGKTVTLPSGVPTTFNATYVLEITSGASAGWWSTVVSSTGTTVVVNDNFPAGLPSGVTVSVRLHNTLKTYFGANTPGLVAFDGSGTNDEVDILDPVSQGVTAVAYVPASISGAAQDGWFDLATSSSADDYIVEPGSSVKIKRLGTSSLTFVSTGTVKTTPTQVDIYPNYNWVGTQSAAGNTVNGMSFNTSLVPFNGGGTYDEIDFVNADQSTSAFAALDPSLGLGQTVGDLAQGIDAGTKAFSQGTGIIVHRIGTTTSSIITIPATVVAP